MSDFLQNYKKQEEPEAADEYTESFDRLAQQTKKQMGAGEPKLMNKELEQKTREVQSEFDRLMEDMMNNRHKREAGDDFYDVMNEYYGRGEDDEKHASPTKRLISLKNSTSDHKKVMAKNIQRGEYSLTYCSSPGKSYVIEPHGGELNYKLAEKNPLKFYEQVFNQDITKHKLKEDEGSPKRRAQVEISSKVTKRPHLKIMEKIRTKIEQKLREKIGLQFGEDIMQALRDQSIEQSIKTLMKQDKIQLLDARNQPVYSYQIAKAASNANDISVYNEDDEAVSPDVKASKTKLVRFLDDFAEHERTGLEDDRERGARLHQEELQDASQHLSL